MPKLKALQVKNMKIPGRYSDGTAGLHLLVKESGSKSWVQRITIGGKRKDIGLGGSPAVTLQQARNMALTNEERRRNGQDLVSMRAGQREAALKPEGKPNVSTKPTFAELAAPYYRRHETSWSVHHSRMVRGILTNHGLPAMGNKPIDTITRKDVISLLEPLLEDRPAMAQKVRAVISGVLGDAEAKDLIEINHAGPVIDRLMRGAGRVKKHQRSLPYDRVADALAAIDVSNTWPIIKLAMRFLALTAARPGEVRFAEWSEIDFEERLWVVPAEKMKSRREHKQPLSDAAMAVLAEAREWDTGHGWIFPSLNLGGVQPLGKDTLTHTLNGLSIPATGHGFRSSFRTWVQDESHAETEVGEAALAHSYGSQTVRSYARGTMLDKRRDLLQEWADYLALA